VLNACCGRGGYTVFKNEKVRQHLKDRNLKFDMTVFLYLVFFKVVPIIGLPIYYYHNSFTWGPWIVFVFFTYLTGMSITMGYHRLFSHKTFKANAFVESALLLFGAMSLQNSCLKWSSDHRTHHSYCDTEKDPYNVKLGFLWSHIMWIFYTPQDNRYVKNNDVSQETLREEFPNCQDLIQNPRVLKQHQYGHKLGLLSNVFVVGLLGYLLNDIWGYALIAGFLRIVAVQQSTFSINSLAHMFGETPFSEAHTAKNSLFCALVSFGEGYHNFHHTYPNDYRCGPAFSNYDPTKWAISGFAKVGMTWDLKRTPKSKYISDKVHEKGREFNMTKPV
jgi:stearoyl-CoA desaturase (delta-9 desaturase)